LARAGVDVLVLGKHRHGDAHTVWAAGGINASLGNVGPEDRWEIHAADTVGEGYVVNDPRMVETLAREAPERILELRDWVCSFSLTDDGSLNQRHFGVHHAQRRPTRGGRTTSAPRTSGATCTCGPNP
jgi:succinate dehydrogenase / fumarate reductase, flavoprotein subunit